MTRRRCAEGTAGRETRDDLLAKAFSRAVDSLGKQFGDVPTEWKWGRLHTATFRHQPLGDSGIALLEKVFNRGPLPARGSGFTVNAAGSDDWRLASTERGQRTLLLSLEGKW